MQLEWAFKNCMKRLNKGRRETKMNKKLVLAAIAREVNFWYDVSLKTDSDITREEAGLMSKSYKLQREVVEVLKK